MDGHGRSRVRRPGETASVSRESRVRLSGVSAVRRHSGRVPMGRWCPLPWPRRPTTPDLAFDGINYLVVSEDTRRSSQAEISDARVSPTAGVLHPAGTNVVPTPSTRCDWPCVQRHYHLVVFENRRVTSTRSERVRAGRWSSPSSPIPTLARPRPRLTSPRTARTGWSRGRRAAARARHLRSCASAAGTVVYSGVPHQRLTRRPVLCSLEGAGPWSSDTKQ